MIQICYCLLNVKVIFNVIVCQNFGFCMWIILSQILKAIILTKYIHVWLRYSLLFFYFDWFLCLIWLWGFNLGFIILTRRSLRAVITILRISYQFSFYSFAKLIDIYASKCNTFQALTLLTALRLSIFQDSFYFITARISHSVDTYYTLRDRLIENLVSLIFICVQIFIHAFIFRRILWWTLWIRVFRSSMTTWIRFFRDNLLVSH